MYWTVDGLIVLVLELIHYGFPRDFKEDAREKELFVPA
jgi:hypothetical protein